MHKNKTAKKRFGFSKSEDAKRAGRYFLRVQNIETGSCEYETELTASQLWDIGVSILQALNGFSKVTSKLVNGRLYVEYTLKSEPEVRKIFEARR